MEYSWPSIFLLGASGRTGRIFVTRNILLVCLLLLYDYVLYVLSTYTVRY